MMLNTILRSFLVVFIGLVMMPDGAFAQSGSSENTSGYISTAVPFLLISADARTSAMGGAGVALLPQASSNALNVSGMAFVQGKSGFAVSYVPWLNKLTKDRKLMYADGLIRLNERSVIGTSLKYLSYGQFELTGPDQQNNGVLSPNEFVVSMNYAMQFGPNFSLGTALSCINSNLYTATGNYAQLHNGNDIAVGISGFFQSSAYLFNRSASIGIGLSLENIGPKMGYDSQATSAFYLPTNLRLGSSLIFGAESEDKLTFAADVNKLLVPSNSKSRFASGSTLNEPSVLAGILNSFTDAPNGLKEELQEIQCSIGFEYAMKNKFAVRTGYAYQNANKGNNSYFSVGMGAKHKNFGFDMAYLAGNRAINSFSNTLRITFGYSFKGS